MSKPIGRAGAILALAALSLTPVLSTQAGSTSGSPKVQILGLNTSEGPGGIQPYSISNDGQLIVLRADFEGSGDRYPGFWTPGTGVMPLDAPASLEMVGAKVSADGSTIVGVVNAIGGSRAFRWRGPGTFERFEPPIGIGLTTAVDVSANGNRFVGTTVFDFDSGLEGFVTTPDDKLIPIGPSRGVAISADGTVVAGVEFHPEGSRVWYWTPETGRHVITAIGDNARAAAQGISPDGSTIYGGWEVLPSRGSTAEPSGFAWSFDTGLRNLSNFGPTFLQPTMVASNTDGSIIAGNAWNGSSRTPAIWLEGSSLPVNGVEYIEGLGYRFPEGLVGISLTDMTDDGMTFIGTGFYKGENVGWVARPFTR